MLGNKKTILVSLIFSLILIFSLGFNVYAITGTVNETGTSLIDSSGKIVATIDEIEKGIKNDYAKKFQNMAKDKYSNTSIIDEIEVSTGDTLYMADTKKDITDIISKSGTGEITFKFEVNNSTEYVVKTYNSHVDIVNSEGQTISVAKNTEAATACGLSFDELNRQYNIAMGGIEFLNKVTGSCRVGLMGGSVGYGYNVGTVYSNAQRSIQDLMEKQDNGTYDFKNINAMKTAFDFYYGPISGRINAFGENKLPTNDDEWIDLLQKKDFTSENNVIIDSGFLEFSKGLSKDDINEEGFKITEKINFSNGVQPFKGIADIKKPASVISYTMKMAYPYVFIKSGNNYRLDTNNLRIEESYYYCLYNDYIYEKQVDGTLIKITDRNELGLNRAQIFSYYQDIYEEQKGSSYPKQIRIGVLLIGEFDEVVVDNKSSSTLEYYATGRKIGFNNGYSELLLFDQANANLMFVNREGGKDGYKPKNVAFICSEKEGNMIMNNMLIHPEAILQGKATRERLPNLSDTNINDNVRDRKSHAFFSDNPPYFKVYIKLHNYLGYETNSKVESIEWSYDDITKTLLFNGKGKIPEYKVVTSAPWYDAAQKGGVLNYVFSDGIDDLGSAFVGNILSEGITVYSPSSLESKVKSLVSGVTVKDISSYKKTDTKKAKTTATGESRYGIIMIRNNSYINDPSLLTWLRTDTARGKSYVKAEELLALITGDFTQKIDKLSYSDWKKMQNIKSELTHNKDMWLVRAFNVMSILMGIFLIIFAILICLAYWIDIFNTFTDFSILQFISFGKMYPVATEDTAIYLRESKGNTQFVKFRHVLLRAFIFCALGVVFMNVNTVVSFIVYLYSYIMGLFGRL